MCPCCVGVGEWCIGGGTSIYSSRTGAVAYLAPLITNKDAKLKRQVCSALGQIAKHSVELAELVVEGEIFPAVLDLLKDADPYVKKNASILIREIAKHTPELAQLIVNAGMFFFLSFFLLFFSLFHFLFPCFRFPLSFPPHPPVLSLQYMTC